ncbi:MAG: rRNA maturation RNase YbeY [Candidatus Kapabacteria bacterium]|nr:rRNA maturation RNase YbeY [Candidatus Kapabacteria bacterium]
MIIEVYNSTETERLPKKKITSDLKGVYESEKFSSGGITRVIFVDDMEIHRLNVEYLNHDYPTDVITFVINEEVDDFDAEIYISIDTAKKQAEEYKVSLHNEVRRLAIHGALHLVGYDDSTDEFRSRMQTKENYYLER